MKNRKLKKFLKELLIYVIIYSIIAVIISIIILLNYLTDRYNIHIDEKDSLFIVLSVVLFPLLIIIFLNRKTFFINTENEIFKITAFFVKLLKLSPEESKKILTEKFPKFKERKILKLYNEVNSLNFKPDKSYTILLKEKNKTRLYVLYILTEISSTDYILSLKEENIILSIAKKLNIQKSVFEFIKQSFVKKGLQEERKILEEQNRKKLLNQFSSFMLPYQAYRVLGVSPSVTKLQLKKAYRTLAKKYHPDKHTGKSDAEIQKIEEKFREIKEAYDLILKTKNL